MICVEFQCTACSFFNYPVLSEHHDGNFTIRCGNCGHEHYRRIKKGVVTEDRHNSSANHGDTIHVMKSAASKEKRAEGRISNIRQQITAGLMR